MSELESFIWTALGYSAMPLIFITGLTLTAVAVCFVLDVSGKE